ncbi:M1 family aminopeptidase [Paraflavitalea sp. CAU 1676]|uniref:M1 family aminopeptidase n=1 Tax=Paraflavitalea sp. CAU 1676 TaxID=3032598 RepID=UPI0023DBD9D6|nr:M1 family aminopeptidase [Paraflavitalea sp. CAU 1676]MDF2191139.1 M1 family aminopeptidase [Paraflavitalea sp. CAU 1676]
MKKWYAILLFTTTCVQAQERVSTTMIGGQPMVNIAELEKRSHLKLLGGQGGDGIAAHSVATENFDIHYYQCDWTLNPEIRYIKGNITPHFIMKQASDSIVFDLVRVLTVDSVLFRGNKIAFYQSAENGLVIKFPAALSVGSKGAVTICYQGVPPNLTSPNGNFFQGLHRSVYAIYTLSEPYGSSVWWPCKNGLTDKADSIDISVTTPSIYTPSSNGLLEREERDGDQTTSHFKHRYPIATYLVALAITKYIVDKDSVMLGDRKMPVLMYTHIASKPDYYKPATAQVIQCLPKFSELFGMYPFQKEHYAQTQWGLGGGMEHQTNSFIVDRWNNLVAHELGHQWFGNKVTCGSWSDLWLNEGFATYTEFAYYEHFMPSVHLSYIASMMNAITASPGGSVYTTDTTNYNRLFGPLTYYKGGLVVHMLRWVLGDEVFHKGVRAYLDDPAVKYGYARTGDLKRVMEQVSGKNLDSFFDKWIYKEGYPSYKLTWSQNNNNWASVKLNQTTSHSSVAFFEMPVALKFKNATRDTILVVDHRFSGQTFALNVGFAADTVLIDPLLKVISKGNTTTKEAAPTTADQLKIYPNPAPDNLQIALGNPTDKTMVIQLFNTTGQLVYQRKLNMAGNDEQWQIPMQQYPKGVYYLRLKGEKNIDLVQKILH